MNRYAWIALMLGLSSTDALAIDNDYVRITRDATTCASSNTPGCVDRVIVALGEVEVRSAVASRNLSRGEVAVFGPSESYEIAGTPYLEVVIKPDHPGSDAPREILAPEKNAPLYDGEDFFIFEEKLAPGDTRARHSHSQRVVIQLNRAKLRQWPDGKPQIEVETTPDRPGFSPPVIHIVENIGEIALRGVIIEFKPGRPGRAQR